MAIILISVAAFYDYCLAGAPAGWNRFERQSPVKVTGERPVARPEIGDWRLESDAGGPHNGAIKPPELANLCK